MRETQGSSSDVDDADRPFDAGLSEWQPAAAGRARARDRSPEGPRPGLSGLGGEPESPARRDRYVDLNIRSPIARRSKDRGKGRRCVGAGRGRSRNDV